MKLKPFKKSAFLISIGLLISVFVINCGSELKDKGKLGTEENVPGDKVIITRHRAFDHFTKGDLFERSGNLEKAADEYRLALFYDPNSDEIKRSLGTVLYELSRYDEALDAALKIEQKSIEDKLLIAGCYNGLNDIDKTIEYYKNVAESDSAPQSVVENLANYYVYKKDVSKAEKYYEWLIANNENKKYWRSELAAAYIKLDKPEKAEKIYTEMIAEDSLDFGSYLGLANVKIYEGKDDAADSIYSHVVRQNWENAQMLSILLPALVDVGDTEMALEVARQVTLLYPDDYLAQRRYGILLFTSQDYQQADSVFEYIISAVDDDPVSYYYRGRIAQQNEKYPEAEAFYRKTIAVDDTMPEAWVNLAFVRSLLDDHEGAIALLDSALVNCPADSVQILFFTGIYLSRQQEFNQAITYYERVLNARPDDNEAKFNLAAAYERSGQFDNAEKLFLELLEANENDALVLNYLGYMYADNGVKLDKAEKLVKKALKLDPNNGAYLDSYAWVMYKKGKYKEALKYQLLAIDASQNTDAILYDHMGDIYFALNKPEQAINHWEKALELDPENDAIRSKLQR